TVDLLGEATVTDEQADRYAARLGALLDTLLADSETWPADEHLERDDIGPLPRVNISVKPTALSAHFAPLTAEQGLAEVIGRLRPILERTRAGPAHVQLDMEHYDVKELTLALFEELAVDPGLHAASLGVVVQAYLRDSFDDLAHLIDLARHRARQAAGPVVPPTVRLVKGAYWDAETIRSRAAGWPVPVYESKEDTDANFDRCAVLLHDHHGDIRAAFGTHDHATLARVVARARRRGVPDNGYEVQVLFGMSGHLRAAARRLGLRVRVYAPVGELVPGMAYLVRRLLENTSNESILRRHPPRAARPSTPPAARSLPRPGYEVRRAPTDPAAPGAYRPEPVAEWRRPAVRRQFAASVEGARRMHVSVPALIGGRAVPTERTMASVDPGDPTHEVATAASCGEHEVDLALEEAQRAQAGWARARPGERAAVLFRAAAWMRERRAALAALEVFETGKPWAEADADVCEAIDYCEYYGRMALVLAGGGPVQSPPGELNRLEYRPRGVGAVIAPWNFPLAIPTGMVAAGLVTGNAVVLKPAEQAPATAWRLVEALRAAGLPDGVLGFLPGSGEVVGARLVRHPSVAFIAFTGSKAVGLDIIEQAAVHRPGQRQVKRVVAEMGGKNAIIVDADADLDLAVPAVISSAFGFSGQKCSACSRLVAVGRVYDELVHRVVGAARGLRIGHPASAGTEMGPLIDGEAYERVRGFIAVARREGRIVLEREDVPGAGYFVGPVVVADVPPGSRVATEEIFGPVLTVMRAGDLDEAIAIANATDYALCAGIVSRSPAHVERAVRTLRAGNIYVNRPITGAVVGRQPFGGSGLSGVGSKAGGPDYLSQFVEPRTISENTVRHGFAPEAPAVGG
ncbi:MAG TPA: proline dehydrogenase family protein, partial [Acidimicrobiales bacterium]|nr:proline dehydrogenase family protein [Acidimicrobiales bacterium]